MGEKDILQNSKSLLIVKKIFIEEMSFKRENEIEGVIRFSNTRIGKTLKKLNDDKYKCSLSLNMSDSSESAKLKIIVSGIFEFNLGFDDEQKKTIITKNTMAILFPYLRAQITIMTSQPDVEPVVLPAININALLKNMDN